MTSTEPDLSGLTPAQREYFRLLENMEPDASFRRTIAAAKRDILRQARAAAAEGSEDPEAPRELRYSGEATGLILEILIDEDELGYWARVSEAAEGGSTDISGKTVAQVLESALRWAGIEGAGLTEDGTVEELRAELAELISAADFQLTVSIYRSF